MMSLAPVSALVSNIWISYYTRKTTPLLTYATVCSLNYYCTVTAIEHNPQQYLFPFYVAKQTEVFAIW